MVWMYKQSTGQLSRGGTLVGIGYSGYGAGLDNPKMQGQSCVGPIPQGNYTIGPTHTPVDHLGPFALPLYADPGNQMFGRFGFFIHGDNSATNYTASNGCIVLELSIRQQIVTSLDTGLIVVA